MSWKDNNAEWGTPETQTENQGMDEDWNVILDEEDDKGSLYRIIPTGTYDFDIAYFKRGHHGGSKKLDPCPKVDIGIVIEYNGDKVELEKTFFICQKLKFWIANLWTCVGLRKRGEQVTVDWSKLPGCSGKCVVEIQKFMKNDGTEGTSNNITKFLDPSE